MAMKLLISEVLQKAHNAKTKAEKIKILKENNSQALRSLFIWNYDDSVVSIIPEGEVPYTPNEAPIGLSLIHILRCRRAIKCRSRWSPYH